MDIRKRASVLFVLFIICVLPAASCSASRGYAMEYNGVTFSEGMYRYWLSSYKSAFLKKYNASSDNTAFWNGEVSDGVSVENFAACGADAYIKDLLISEYIFRKNGYVISNELYAAIDEDINEKIAAAGGCVEFDRILGKVGIDADTLRKIYSIEEMSYAVRRYLFGSGGEYEPTQDEIIDYYNENYFCLKVIPIYNSVSVGTDGDGNTEYRDLSDGEKAEKKKLISDVLALIENGENVDGVIEKYTEKDMSAYPDGIVLSADDYGRYETFVSAAARLEEGQCTTAEDGGLSYIIYKDALPDYFSLDEKTRTYISSVGEYCAQKKYEKYFSELRKDVKADSGVTGKYSLRDAPRLSGGI